MILQKVLFSDTAQCLIEMGEALKQMADVKYSLDDNIKQSFLEPLHHLQTKDLKEVMVSDIQNIQILNTVLENIYLPQIEKEEIK